MINKNPMFLFTILSLFGCSSNVLVSSQKNDDHVNQCVSNFVKTEYHTEEEKYDSINGVFLGKFDNKYLFSGRYFVFSLENLTYPCLIASEYKFTFESTQSLNKYEYKPQAITQNYEIEVVKELNNSNCYYVAFCEWGEQLNGELKQDNCGMWHDDIIFEYTCLSMDVFEIPIDKTINEYVKENDLGMHSIISKEGFDELECVDDYYKIKFIYDADSSVVDLTSINCSCALFFNQLKSWTVW